MPLMTQGDAPAPMAFDKVMFYPDTTEDNGDGFLWWGMAPLGCLLTCRR
jgi:hypothetical protein